jgi:hypothetical protein
MRTFIAILLIAVLIGGCTPSQKLIDEAVSKTLTALPTQTRIPTDTPIPTITFTPTVTLTRTPQFTPTSTKTKAPTLTSSQKTATSNAATKAYMDLFKSINYKELRDYPDQHKGEQVKVQGRIMQIIGGIDMLVYFSGTYDLFYVVYKTPYSGVYENNQITVYGTVAGNYCYDTAAGGQNCVPKINNAFFVK